VKKQEFITIKHLIDPIALEMIDQINTHKEPYYKYLNKTLNRCLLYDISYFSIEEETNKLNEIFRDPNNSLHRIMQLKRENDMKIHNTQNPLTQMTGVRQNLHLNQFNANNSFDQQDLGMPTMFGILELKLNTYLGNLSNSKILNEQQSLSLIKLCELSYNDEFELLYRASRDS